MIKRGERLLKLESSRSSQATIYISIAFIILISLILLGTAKKNEDASKFDVDIEHVQINDLNLRNFVQSCVDSVAKNAVFYLGFIGGHLQNEPFPNFFYYDSYYRIPYYYYDGESQILTEDGFMNLVLAKYMNDNLRKCTNNFKAFQDTRIVDANVKTKVDLTDNEVIFNLVYPVSINRVFQVRNIDRNYITEVKVRLKEIINIAQNIVENEVKDDRQIHWNYLTDVSNRNFNITAYTEDDNTIIYRITDLDNEIDKEPYVFQWANKIKLKGK